MNSKLAALMALASSACIEPGIVTSVEEPRVQGLELCADVDVSSITFDDDTLRDDQVVELTNNADCDALVSFTVDAELDDPHQAFNLESSTPLLLEPADTSSFVLQFISQKPGEFDAQLILNLTTEFAQSSRRVQLYANHPAPQE
ncbi:MAG: hypothetical protein ACI9MC_003288 [Kiritimatiellia bacterium]|jgi:hypothetical protein